MSDVIEVAGFVCLAAGVFLLFGAAVFVAAAGVELLVYSYLLERAKVARPAVREEPVRRLRGVG